MSEVMSRAEFEQVHGFDKRTNEGKRLTRHDRALRSTIADRASTIAALRGLLREAREDEIGCVEDGPERCHVTASGWVHHPECLPTRIDAELAKEAE